MSRTACWRLPSWNGFDGVDTVASTVNKLSIKTRPRVRAPAVAKPVSAESALIAELRSLIMAGRRAALRQVDALQLRTNFEIGRRIVEHEQGGEGRAEYGAGTLNKVSAALAAEFGRGFSVSNLKLCRLFYLQRHHQIGQTVSGFSAKASISNSKSTRPAKSQTVSGFSQSAPVLPALSWSHCVFLLGIADPNEQSFYEVESASQGWSLRELERQFNSALYERLALSRNKAGVRALARKGQQIATASDLIKDPCVLEFLGLEERAIYTESDLETAIIDKLGQFMLELGKGFLFEARQRRFTLDGDHYFVDLVFYNRLLRCYVLVDLKLGKLAHQDLGQMQMYVNHFDRFVKLPDEAPTVGIVLCKMKSDALVKITLPKHSNITAARYQTHLPDKAALKRQLLGWADELGGGS